jgi:hypothetical protein
MKRIRAQVATAGVVVTLAALLLVTTLSGTASASHKQTPILECVFQDTRTRQWVSLWGYNNSSGSVETIPIGSGNGFSPGAQNQGQPTAFKPGLNHNVFTVIWNGSSALTWTLNGQTASATTTSTKCSTNPVPILAGTDGWSFELPLVLLALGILGVGFCCWRFDLGVAVLRRP